MFEIRLCRKSYWIQWRYGHAYESRYLEPIFKSERSFVGIWSAISLYFNSELAIITQGQKMNSKQYIELVFNKKAHPFYEKVIEHHRDAIS